jgi:hypothetical protein
MPVGEVTFRCDCGTGLSFSSFDEDDEQVQISCPTCLRVWMQKRTRQGWEKTLVSDSPKTKPK